MNAASSEPDWFMMESTHLVALYDGIQWDAADDCKQRMPNWTISKAKEHVERQAEELSANERHISAVAINAA